MITINDPYQLLKEKINQLQEQQIELAQTPTKTAENTWKQNNIKIAYLLNRLKEQKPIISTKKITCKIPKCNNKIYVRQLCRKHWQQLPEKRTYKHKTESKRF